MRIVFDTFVSLNRYDHFPHGLSTCETLMGFTSIFEGKPLLVENRC